MRIAIDFGGTNIKLGLVDQGRMIAHSTLPSYSGNGMLGRLPAVEQEIGRLLGEHRLALTDCDGIGIATPGLVDTTSRTIISINDKYADAVGFSFRDWTETRFSLPFELENDARAALLGEVAYGAGRGAKDAVLLTFGTGIGTAAMMNGQILRGKHYQAGILGGHFATDIYGNTCNCGGKGCLEAQAGHWALPYAIGRHSSSDLDGSALSGRSSVGYKDVIDAAESGDRLAGLILEELIDHWSAGIINMIHAYDPDIVILSGGLMKAADRLLPPLRERVEARSWTPWGNVQLVVARDPDASVLLGAASLLGGE